MARPSKKVKAEEASKALDRLFAEVDPNLMIVAMLGGSAAAGGLVPPLTRLLMTVGKEPTVISEDYAKMFAGAAVLGPGGMITGVLPAIFALYVSQNPTAFGASGNDKDPRPAALFASGALEAMLMYKAFSTPGLLEAVIKAPAEMMKGIGEVVPG